MIILLVAEAVGAGARFERACEVIGIAARTVARWKSHDVGDDQRRGPRRSPPHKLSEEERKRILDTVNSAEFRDRSPRQIVPLLADRGDYIASESTIYRVLREEDLLHHRGRARPPMHHKPKEYVASAPNQVWSWDITYLKSAVRGVFFYLYLIVDVYSRKIVGWDVHFEECALHSTRLIERAMRDEKVDRDQLVLHSDNGGPMRGSTMLATLQRLGVVPSFSRPSVSDDNPYIESLFRTLKYTPGFPMRPFLTIAHASEWVEGFLRWYNFDHLHSALRYVTPADRHALRDHRILARRARTYAAARKRNPNRWTGDTRDWTPIGSVYLNPVKHLERTPHLASEVAS